MNAFKNRVAGFTLIEMLLVLVIIATILLGLLGYTQQKAESMRRDRTAMQMQQIENAALAYYVGTSSWPADIATLQAAGFLPASLVNNPYGNPYYVNSDVDTGNFAVCTAVTSNNTTNAMSLTQTIAGMLPFGFVSDTADPASSCSPNLPQATSCSQTSCTVVTWVNIPGQNLNNARSVNFAGMYKNGGCVPVPKCPGSGANAMTPAIMVVPVSVSGVYNYNNEVVPISSFTARATAPAMMPNNCLESGATPQSCNLATPGPYWRVCLQVWTQDGEITSSTNTQGWGEMTSLMAITRCVPNNEPVGSDFSVYQNE